MLSQSSQCSANIQAVCTADPQVPKTRTQILQDSRTRYRPIRANVFELSVFPYARPDGSTNGQKLTDVLDQKTGDCHPVKVSLTHWKTRPSASLPMQPSCCPRYREYPRRRLAVPAAMNRHLCPTSSRPRRQKRRGRYASHQRGSVPGRWVTDHSDHIGNTFERNGFFIGSSLTVSASK
jgi:hypothetical protein